MNQQTELPMKDVTPKKASTSKPKTAEAAKPAKNAAPAKPAGGGGKPPARPKAEKTGTALAPHKPRAEVAPAAPKSVLQIIAEAASNPKINPDNMRALLDMQKEIVAEERRMAFDTAFIALQAELPVIDRDGKIEIREKDANNNNQRTGRLQQATPYATFEAIMDVIQPLLTKFGFGLSFETEPTGERLLVRGHLIGHGHERKTAFPLPAETSGSKNNVQGWGSSMSYGKRYCTIALLNIRSRAPQDRDVDGHEGRFQNARDGGLAQAPQERPKVSRGQLEELKIAIEDCGVSEDAFCRHYGIAKIEDLPADLLDAAKKQCAQHKEQRVANARDPRNRG